MVEVVGTEQQSEMASRLKVLLLILFYFITPSTGEIGTATSYIPQYTPHMVTACGSIFSSPKIMRSFKVSYSNFSPGQNMKGIVFAAAAGESMWLNGASCGQIYNVTCVNTISNTNISYPCKYSEVFQVMIWDFVDGGEYVLSLLPSPFKAIANPFAKSMTIEYSSLF